VSGPLAGIRVIEFGNLVAGPYAGMLLADMGADVVKVEPPGGDLARAIGPFRMGIRDEPPGSVFFASVNRGKRSVVIDLGDDDGRAAAAWLCDHAQVVLHNLRPGAMERAGLGAEELRRRHPGLVYCAISGFGGTGPDTGRAGVDVIFQAESGMLSINGEPGSGPQKTATTIGDYMAGTNAAFAIAAALAGARGASLDVSLRDGLIAVQGGWNSLYFHQSRQPDRTGSASPFLAPNQVFTTADGHIAVAIVSDRHYRLFCEVLGVEVDYLGNEERLTHRTEIAERTARVLVGGTTGEWMEVFEKAGLPAGRVMTLPEVFTDRQVQARRMRIDMDGGSVTGSPIWVDGSPALREIPPPELGAHTDEVSAEVGLR
jgi:crotonobetainyl-CoA:carnitine CoA-transferase CaiB-like acyl-CoA transferase